MMTIEMTVPTRHGITTLLYHVRLLLLLLQSSCDSRNDSSNDSSYKKSFADACDFYSHVGCVMSGTVFKKKSSFMDDDDTKVHAALPGAKEQIA